MVDDAGADQAPAAAPVDLPNLRHLRLFDAAVTLQSLTMAAHSVHISQPAASQAINKLGRIFGRPLLERVGNGVVPTQEGVIVHRRARRILDHLADANRRLAARSRQVRGLPGDLLERQATMAQLRAIGAVAETGSFSAAARRLGQAEPSVQRACREIERTIVVSLFDVGARSLRMTPAGEVLAESASLALKEIVAAHAELREIAGLFDSRLVLGTLPLVRTRIVPDAVVALLRRHPCARVEIIDGSYDMLVRLMRSGGCDMIIGALREGKVPHGFEEETLLTDTLSIVARAGHPLAGRQLRGPELAAYPWVLPRRDTPSRAIFDRLQATYGVADPNVGHVETGSLVALRGILLASDALAQISLRQVDYEVRQGLLIALDAPLCDSERAIGLTTLANWQPTALQSAFVDCLRETVG